MVNERLAELLGQDTIAGRLSESLEVTDVRVARLTGPSGSGKSEIGRGVAAVWGANGGRCVIATGDDQHSWRELFPLLSGLSRVPTDWMGLAATGTRSAIRVADSAAGATGAATSIFDLLAAAFRQRSERALRPYGALERDVLLDLRRLARGQRLLVVAENAHWWDGDSLRLLADVISDGLGEVIPPLRRVSVLLVDSAAEQGVVARDAFDALLAQCAETTIETSRCTEDQFPEVLAALGAPRDLPRTVASELFAVVHGHLKLVEQIAAYERETDLGASPDQLDPQYLGRLFRQRFASLGSGSPDVIDLLIRAAILGLSCGERELECVADKSRGQLRALLDQAEQIGFVRRSPERVTFCHDVIRAGVLDGQPAPVLAGLYQKFAICLSILRPGDYAARAQALQQGGSAHEVREMVALAGVSQIRRGVALVKVLARTETLMPGDLDLVAYLELIAEAYVAVADGDFSSVVPRLGTPIQKETTGMAAERNYVAAICALGSQTRAGADSARRTLTSWIDALDAFVELKLRFLLLLQQAQVLCERFDAARTTEMQIEQTLSARASYDIEAAVLTQIQNRRSGGVMSPEVARDRIRSAVAFFRRGTGEAIRDERELYRSLTNLAAVEVRLDDNASAYEHALEAEEIAMSSPEASHRLDVLASGLVLSGYRSGSVSIDETIRRQTLVVHSPEGSKDNFIQRCNLAAYMFLGGHDDEAGQELEGLGQAISSNGIDESYLVYYYTALTVAEAALRGEPEESLRRHHAMDEFVASLRWPYASYVRRRQALLLDALAEFDSRQARTTADRILLDSRPNEIGPAWAYYARLIPCAELSFWSDS